MPTTGWQRSFRASVRYNRKIGLESNLRQAILEGALLPTDDIRPIAQVYETSQKRVRELFQETLIERSVLQAAEKNDEHLQDMLQVAIEQIDETQANRLLDKVHQVMTENLRDIRGWKE